MTEVTNRQRATWAAYAIKAFAVTTNMRGESDATMARDLVADIIHYLRLECGMSYGRAIGIIDSAIGKANAEIEEDRDD